MRVEQRRIALNKTLSFKTTHTLKARRRRKSHPFRKLDVRNSPIFLQFIQDVTINAVEIFARALLAIYHYYCLSVFLPYSCSGSVPSLPEPILLLPVRHWVTQGYVRSPLPDGSHRHHAWRLSTPCVDFVNPDKNGICVHENSPHAKYCFSSSLNVFAKAQGIVKAKHRFLVQDARYSSSTLVDSHFFVL